MPDRHIRRSGDDYAEPLAALLPTGAAWPRDPASVLMRVVRGLAQVWGTIDGRAADLLEVESDPRKTLELLADWERNWALPDPCFAEAQTIEDRRRVLLLKMTIEGAQSREFFVWAAGVLGYTITITEFSPFMCGLSCCGDGRASATDQGPRWQIGAPEMRFYWVVHVSGARLSWFRASSGQAGIDPHLRIGIATDLECLLRRWKPAHTEIVFDYSGAGTSDPMAGTP